MYVASKDAWMLRESLASHRRCRDRTGASLRWNWRSRNLGRNYGTLLFAFQISENYVSASRT